MSEGWYRYGVTSKVGASGSLGQRRRPSSALRRASQLHRMATHSVIPIARKHFQLPSGSFLSTASTVPRTCVGSPPGDATNDALKERHSTAPPSQILKSLVSGTKVNT